MLIQSPHHTPTQLALARAYLGQGQADEALKLLKQSLDLDQSDPLALFYQAKAFLLEQAYAEALAGFKQLERQSSLPRGLENEMLWYLAGLSLALDPDQGQGYLDRLSSQAKATEKAHLQATLANFPNDMPLAEQTYLLGVALVQLEAWSLAHHALLAALSLDENQAEAWAFLGYVQSQLDLSFEASFRRAETLAADSALTPYFEGIALRRQANYDQAVERFLYALDLDPNNPAIALETARTLAEKGDYLFKRQSLLI